VNKPNILNCKTFLRDSISIYTENDDIVKNSSLIKIFTSNSVDYISILNCKNNTINFFPTQKGYKNFEQKLPSVPNEIYDYKIENSKSIYMVCDNNRIYLCNDKGIIKDYTLKENIPLFKNNYCLFSAKNFPLEVYKNKILVYNMPQERLDDIKSQIRIFKTKRDMHLEVKNGKLVIESITGSYPSEFQSNNNFNNFFPARTLNSNTNKVIYSFSHSKNIEVVDLETNKSKTLVLEADMFAKNDSFPFSKLKDMNFKNKYTVENDRFISMIYDKYNRKYIRVLSKGIKYENSDGTVNDVLDKPLYFLIYNENFKLEKVVKFPEKKYNYLSILATSKGILVSKDHPFNKEKNKMKYDLFKFY